MSEDQKAEDVKWLSDRIEQTLIQALGRDPTPAEFAMFTIGWKMCEALTKIFNEGKESKTE